MEQKQLFSFAGLSLLTIACFLPLANLNEFIISILPVWDNRVYQFGFWNWRDISFFAVTLLLLIILSTVFTFKKNYTGILITSLLVSFVAVIIFVTVLQVQLKVSGYSNISFNLGWGWISLVPGIVLLITAALKKTA